MLELLGFIDVARAVQRDQAVAALGEIEALHDVGLHRLSLA
ncbi:MAG: hypothetical protein R3B07_22855 [Polyangiaceae bacterium]